MLWISDVATVLAVHAHPDDETLTTGGTLARCAAEGVRTVVVTCTRGDLGLPGDRQRELEAACGVLGVSRLVQLGFGDSGMPGTSDNQRPGAFCQVDLPTAVAALRGVLEQEQPDVVITYDETGGYGHPDHVRAHTATVAAAQDHPARLYFVSFPLSWSRAFVRALREVGIDAPGSAAAGADAGPEVAEIGVADERITTSLDVSAYVQTKRAALACHRSQIGPDHFLARAPTDLLDRLWAREFFQRAGGPNADTTDLMQGLGL
jgi:LmbE family N-acetylglucosaminyl deacetylase